MAIFPGSAIPSAVSDYEIDNSLRFNIADSAYLRKVFSSAGDRKTWTLSLWVKRGKLGANQALLYAGSDTFEFRFDSADNINLYQGGTTVLDTSAVYRDPSSWYHIVLAVDTTQGTDTNRVKLYVNGDQVTAFGTTNYPAEDAEWDVGNAVQHTIGAWDTDDEFYGGYLAELYYINGTALAASDFGELDSDTNQWIPLDSDTVKDAVTFGTNGFYQRYNSTELADSFGDSSGGFIPTENLIIDAMLVGGGGGGSNAQSGGGGGGSMITLDGFAVTAKPYPITIGAGGSGSNTQGSQGGSTTAFGETATGGGGGGFGAGGAGANGGGGGQGGSGGAGTTPSVVSSQATAFGGYNGGAGPDPAGGGGGGLTAAGVAGVAYNYGGAGGAGKQYNLDGNNYYWGGGGGGASYATSGTNTGNGGDGGIGGGGGGGTYSTTGGTGGTGGGSAINSGGDGTDSTTVGGAGGANTGGGAGGGGNSSGGSGIVQIRYASATAKATGGTITTYTDSGTQYQVHTFTSSAGHTITANGDVKNVRSIGNFECEYLVVAGGGGGAGEGGGGGGAGGMRTGTTNLYNGVSYAITVGAGGGGTASGFATQGSDSSLGSVIVSTGGAKGAPPASNGQEGGSGGGAGYGGNAGAGNTPSTSPSQGANGGAGGPSGGGSANSHSAGGGGGGGASGTAGAAGSNVSGSGNGGNGTASSISGSSVTYAGGGGGGTIHPFYSGSGGTGGGGAAGSSSGGAGSNGTDGLGGGGGGASGTTDTHSGGDGGNGIVIIRYESATNLATGGTITTDGDYKIHTFTSSGTFEPTSATRPGSSAIEFDGTGDYLTVPDSSDWAFGTDNFTVEFWMNHQSVATGNVGITFSPTTDKRQLFGYVDAGDGLFKLYLTSDGSNWDIASGVSMGTAQLGAWVHYAIVRSGTSFYTFQNGTQISTFTDSDSMYDSSDALSIGRYASSTYLDGYMDEIRISDSARYTSAFTPQTTQFTADANTLLLIHSDWTGGLGADSSGNYNNFTATNLVATDQMVDTPTNNFATMNPINPCMATYLGGNGQPTFSNVNTTFQGPTGTGGAGYCYVTSTISAPSGKWYCEFRQDTSTDGNQYAIAKENYAGGTYNDFYDANAIYYHSNGHIYNATVDAYTGASLTTGDIVGVAFDVDAKTAWFAKNNTWQGSGTQNPATDAGGYDWTFTDNIVFGWADGHATNQPKATVNFGSDSSFVGAVTAQGNQDGNGKGDFYYEPPSGYLALCTDNLSDPEIKLPGENFNTLLWTGDGAASRSITGTGFQADMMWSKIRNSVHQHNLVDRVRGVDERLLMPNLDNTEDFGTPTHGWFDSLDADGFTITGAGGDWNVNTNTYLYVGWNWKAGGTASSNTDGTITSSVSANTTAGFSIVSYTGDDASSATIGHGLSVAPELIIIKSRDSAEGWYVGSSEGPMSFTSSDYLTLNTNNGESSASSIWDDTAPSASVFTVGTNNAVNNTDDFIAYCFHSVEGYSKVGGWVATGSDPGPFFYCGFKPAFVMVKNTSRGNSNWWIMDNKRSTYNMDAKVLFPNSDQVEASGRSECDFLSNGVKFRGVVNPESNYSTDTYLIYAVAESPFKTANAR